MTENRIVIIGASWCGPCKVLKGFAADVLVKQNVNVKVVYLDIDDDEEEVEAIGVSKLPTVVFESNKKEVSRFVGSKRDGFEKFVGTVGMHLTLDSAFADA